MSNIDCHSWLVVFRRFIIFITFSNLIWEFLQMPLYTIWITGTQFEIAFAVFHCTGGDVLIALCSLNLALIVFGTSSWPRVGYYKVFIATVTFGIAYTIFSEWLNIDIRESWTYSDLMPVIPIINAGLSPVLQWVVLPSIGLLWSAGKMNFSFRRN